MPSPRRIVVRPPSPRLALGEVTHIDRRPVDPELAARQWADYVGVFREAGWGVVELPARDEHPDGVFVEDAVVTVGEVAVIARPGAPSRRDETEGLAATFSALGFEIAEIEAPGTLDGGDVLKVGTSVYVGRSARSNESGIAQLRRVVESVGGWLTEVPVTAALHLKSCVTALPDETIVGHRPLVDTPGSFSSIRWAEEESGAHVVDLGDGQILVAASCPTTAAAYEQLGWAVDTVDISEFEKLEGCVTCLSVRLHDGVD